MTTLTTKGKAAGLSTTSTLFSYGHSFTMDNYPYIDAKQYGEYGRVAARTLGVEVDMNGRSGTRLLDTVSLTIGPGYGDYRNWVPGTDHGDDVVLLQNGHNDQASATGGDPAYRSGYELGLRTMLGVFGSRRFISSDDNINTYGLWTRKTYDRVANGSIHYTKDYGAKIDFTVSGDTCHIETLISDAALTYATMRIEVNGVTVGYFNGTGKMLAWTDSVDDTTLNRWMPVGIRIKGMDSIATGYKTLTLRKVTNDTTSALWVGGVWLTSGTPPRVFVGMEPDRNPEATSQGAVNCFYANNDAYREIVTRVCSEYNYATCVDLNPGWNNETMVATGRDPYNFHPNQAGMNFLANKFVSAIVS